MKELNFNIEYLFSELSNTDKDIEVLLNNPTEFPTDIIEQLSIKTALSYWIGKIDYKTGDYIMNQIFGFWTTNQYYFENFVFPEIAWDCFNAFDSGEFYHNEDDREIDPIEKYTKPAIEKLLRDRKLIS